MLMLGEVHWPAQRAIVTAAPDLILEAGASLGGQLGPVACSVDKVGLRLVSRFTDGNAGPFDIAVGGQSGLEIFPLGTGRAIMTSVPVLSPPVYALLVRDLDTDGLDVSEARLEQLLSVDTELVKAELPAQHQHLARFGDELPQELHDELRALEERLGK